MQRILIVEDNQVNQLVLVRMLEKVGIIPEVATDGVEAVERVRAAHPERPYALIFMDCMMPRMDGIEATRLIRSEEEGDRRIYIIAVTANVFANDYSKCLAAGMDDYLPKPITPLALHEVLNRWRESMGMIKRGSARLSQTPTAIGNHDPNAKVIPRVVAVSGVAASGTVLNAVFSSAEACTASASEAASQVDFTNLRTLARLAGRSAMQGIVTCFLSEIDGMHLDIRQALQVMDMTQIQHAAHKLRGSCGTVGLRQVQADALAIEMAAKKADHVLLEQAVANLERHLAESLTRLAAFSAET